MTRFSFLISVLSLQICCNLAFAGGPLIIQGASGNTPVTYQNPNITIHVENGDLGMTTPIINNANANVIMQQAIDLWNDITSSSVNLTIDNGTIGTDIDISNFTTVLPNTDFSSPKTADGLNPIVYDLDGSIIDAYFGVGQSNTTIGFAASFFTLNGDFYSEGFAVLNGKNIGLSATEIRLLIAHEIGHFFGIDHSQINIDNTENIFGTPGLCLTATGDNYPVMYPIACRDTVALHLDDEVAASALYPNPSISTAYGILQGNLLDQTGAAIVGANVFAINTTDPTKVVSITSDFLKQRNGFYKLHLPAGNYTLHVNSINTLFNGGSGIGPYANTILDESFTSPHPLTAATLQDESTGNDAVITITNGSTTNISFTITVPVNVQVEEEADDKKSSSGKILGALFFTPLLLLSLLSVLRRFR